MKFPKSKDRACSSDPIAESKLSTSVEYVVWGTEDAINSSIAILHNSVCTVTISVRESWLPTNIFSFVYGVGFVMW